MIPRGKIRFAEYSNRTVAREIKEELGTSIKNIKLIEVIENMDDYRGKFVHEILFVYFADFKDPDQYNKDFFELIEGGGAEKYIATWISLENFYNDKFRMYPRRLLHTLIQKLPLNIISLSDPQMADITFRVNDSQILSSNP